MLLLIPNPQAQHVGEPVAHCVRLFQPRQQRQDLLVELRLVESNAGVTPRVVARASVVDVLFPGLRFDDALAGYRVTTVRAADQLTGVRQLVRLVRLLAEQHLHAIPHDAIDDCWVRTSVPLTAVEDLADVRAVAQDLADLAARPRRLRVSVLHAFAHQVLGDHVNRAVLMCVQIEDVPDFLRAIFVDFHDAPTVSANVSETIRGHADEQAGLHAASQSFLHINALLLCVERCHRRQHPALHSSRRRLLGGLTDRDERDFVLALQAFQLDVIEQVPCRAIDLVEEQTVDLIGVLLHICDQFLERLPFIGFARGFGDSVQLHDLAAVPFHIALNRLDLNIE